MNLIPKEYDFYRKLYNYNNYLKTLSKGNNFILNNETKQDEIYKLTYNNKKIDKNDYIEIQIKAWEE